MNKLIDNINDLSNLKEDMIQHGFDRLNRKMLEDIIASLRELESVGEPQENVREDGGVLCDDGYIRYPNKPTLMGWD